MSKRLYKSNNDRVFAGVCGGFAEFFGIDTSLVRLGWVVFCLLGGSGFLAYIVAALIIPSNTLGNSADNSNSEQDNIDAGGWR